VERVHRNCLCVPGDNFAGLPAGSRISSAAAGSLLRVRCHDLMEPPGRLRRLAQPADALRNYQLQLLRSGNEKARNPHIT
jgi:hypothetical protein